MTTIPDPPDPITTILNLAAQLPPGLQASSRDTNHFELTAPQDTVSYWWLDLGEMLHPFYAHNALTYDHILDRLQILLDLAAAVKAAEPQIRTLLDASAALSQPRPFRPCPSAHPSHPPPNPPMTIQDILNDLAAKYGNDWPQYILSELLLANIHHNFDPATPDDLAIFHRFHLLHDWTIQTIAAGIAFRQTSAL